jgi:aldehyde dehydrogenase (NAD+)
MDISALLDSLNIPASEVRDGDLKVTSPIDGEPIAAVRCQSIAEARAAIARAQQAFLQWRMVPAPRRGELLRLFGDMLRSHKQQLGMLISIETGKILQEGRGEVQEMVDICEFALGLSRQLHGYTIASERPAHRMMETWHPLGVVGVVSAFNFPAAVWAWNAALAIACGDSVVWKPSEKTPLTALACQSLFRQACDAYGAAPDGLVEVIQGTRDIGEALVCDTRVPLISATGSTRMGREVAPRVAQRFGRTILELGGNNAAIIAPSADLSLALRAVLFAAVGTAGQRCTSLRRLIVHGSIYDSLLAQLKRAYESLRIGNPLDEATLVGPLIDASAFEAMQNALRVATEQGGVVIGGERIGIDGCEKAHYVRPALVEMPAQTGIMRQETFAPILYILKYDSLDEAIALQNDVPQGLSSSIFTTDLREAERFISTAGSDCGIANVNIGPSGAEIGGAFGGEKETGGGRESGSDSWKSYMRRATNTINHSSELPLAQGIRFDL